MAWIPMTYLEHLEKTYPLIPWRKPICINTTHFACRICIALNGIRGSEIASLPTEPEEILEHIEAMHVNS